MRTKSGYESRLRTMVSETAEITTTDWQLLQDTLDEDDDALPLLAGDEANGGLQNMDIDDVTAATELARDS